MPTAILYDVLFSDISLNLQAASKFVKNSSNVGAQIGDW